MKIKSQKFNAANAAAKESPSGLETVGSGAVQACQQKDSEPLQSKVFSAYFATATIKETGTGSQKTKNISFEPIENALIGYKIYIIVETGDMPGGKITVEILGSYNTTFVAPNTPAAFKGADITKFVAKVGNFTSRNEFKNASAFKDQAIVELDLRANDDAETKRWIKKIDDSTEKKAFLHLKITSTGGTDTLYHCHDDSLVSPNKEKGVFYNKKDSWFEVYACLCSKKLIALDLQILGISKANATKFLDAINLAATTYSINTCLRLTHFLAQTRHESGDFAKRREGWGPTTAQLGYEGRADLGNNVPGDGLKFKGRGLIQVTGRKNYTAYGTAKGQDFITGTNNERLEEVTFAVDSAGWYWCSYLNVNLNTYADADDLIYCTYRVNGGFTGYPDRLSKAQFALNALKNCRKTELSTKGNYTFETSRCYNEHDAVYQWANKLHAEGTNARAYYQHYMDLTINLTGLPPNEQQRINYRRNIAQGRI